MYTSIVIVTKMICALNLYIDINYNQNDNI